MKSLNGTNNRKPGMLKALQDKHYLDGYRAKSAGIEKRPQSVHSYIQFNRALRQNTYERTLSIKELRISQGSNFVVRAFRKLWRVFSTIAAHVETKQIASSSAV